ncbi:hypothetical protein [Flavobacterium sp.]|uniref:hypothetical protein n=1 Tax=Flavobacterium sp. TaxID=239 RepID=UPI00262A3E36|nr:hypothetical protein [Flavobacterium sp.]
MLRRLLKLFRREQPQIIYRWRTQQSLYLYIFGALDESGKLPADFELPQLYTGPGTKVYFPEGALIPSEKIRELAKQLKHIANTGNEAAAAGFYETVVSLPDVLDVIDLFLEEISNYALPIEPHLFSFAHDMAFCTGHINSSKFGIAILGLCQNRVVSDKLKIMAVYEKLTVYSTIALLNLSANPQDDLFDIAGKLHGWGKIKLVSRLAVICKKDSIKEWLIAEGYKNTVDNSYIACTCAFYGELHKKLEKENIEIAFFNNATDILQAMLTGNPSECIATYRHAVRAVTSYLLHAKTHAKTIQHFLIICHIKFYLEQQLLDCDRNNGWSDNAITNCLTDCAAILNNDFWKSLIKSVLVNPDDVYYNDVKQAAGFLHT